MCVGSVHLLVDIEESKVGAGRFPGLFNMFVNQLKEGKQNQNKQIKRTTFRGYRNQVTGLIRKPHLVSARESVFACHRFRQNIYSRLLQ